MITLKAVVARDVHPLAERCLAIAERGRGGVVRQDEDEAGDRLADLMLELALVQGPVLDPVVQQRRRDERLVAARRAEELSHLDRVREQGRLVARAPAAAIRVRGERVGADQERRTGDPPGSRQRLPGKCSRTGRNKAVK